MTRTLLLAMMLSLFSTADGAIVFRELTPGEVFRYQGGVIYNDIDLNADGTIDFFTSSAGSEAALVPTGNNRVLSIVATLPDLGRAITPLSAGAIIGNAPMPPSTWNGLQDRVNQFDDGGAYIYRCNGRVQPGSPPECDSTIPPSEVRYVGLELDLEGEAHYGWVALSSLVTVVHSMQVHAWAYESDSSVPIEAGVVPEPTTTGLLALSLSALIGIRARTKSAQQVAAGASRGSAFPVSLPPVGLSRLQTL